MSYDVVLSGTAGTDGMDLELPEIHEPIEVLSSSGLNIPNILSTSSGRTVTEPLATTPSRKISTSRFMNAFAQFYGNDEDITTAANSEASKVQQRSYDDSFPEIKGRVESKLMSMWHNVKYGE